MAIVDVLMSPTTVLFVMLVVASVAVGSAVLTAFRRYLRDRPPARTSARDRLLERNPALSIGGELRWTVASRRQRTSALTSLVVSVALLIASDRPRRIDATTSDNR